MLSDQTGSIIGPIRVFCGPRRDSCLAEIGMMGRSSRTEKGCYRRLPVTIKAVED